MKKYQNIMEEVQQRYRKAGKGLEEILENSRGAERMLFLNLSTGLATCRGTSFSFDAVRPESLELCLKAYAPSYITILASAEENAEKTLTAPSEALRPEGIWGSSVWEVYSENYMQSQSSAKAQARLQLFYYSLLLSRNSLVQQKFCESSLVNIFGWLYEPLSYSLTDICLDVFFSFDEEYMLCQE